MYPFNIKEFATEFYNRKMDFAKHYGSAQLARSYYEKAALLSKDREFAAKALYCAKIAAEKYKTNENSYWPAVLSTGADRFLRKLKDGYSDTKVYRELSAQSSYLADFK